MIYSEAIKQVSIELGLPPQVVKEAYESYWTFIRNNIKALPLKEDLSKEEFDKLRTNFNIPSIGKLSCTYDRMIGVKKRFEHIRRLREGKCTIELGFAHSDILNNLERVSDHCSNIAVDVIQSDKENFDTHEYLDAMKNRDNQQFAREYKEYKEKYRLPETRKFV